MGVGGWGGGGVCQIYYNITWGGLPDLLQYYMGGGRANLLQYYMGGGSSETPKLYYVIYEQPLNIGLYLGFSEAETNQKVSP